MGSPDYERSTTATTLAALPEPIRSAVCERASSARVSRAGRRLLHGLRRVRAKQAITAND